MNAKPIPELIAQAMRRKAVYESPDGTRCYLNSYARAQAIAAKHGGQAFPPEESK
jgi:hypothetical protein